MSTRHTLAITFGPSALTRWLKQFFGKAVFA